MRKLRFAIVLLVFALTVNSQTPLTLAVDFTVTDIDGNIHTLFDYLDNGKNVMVEFFSVNNPSSQQATPLINQSYINFGCNAGNVIYIGIDFGDLDVDVVQFANTFGMGFPVVSGINGGGNEVCDNYQITIYPTNILIGPDHNILSQNLTPYYLFTNIISLLGGIPQPCPETIVADFTMFPQTVVVGTTTDFFDLSSGNPVTWIWTLNGGFPSYSTDQNPGNIEFGTTGIFPVTLLVSNGMTSDSKTDLVHVVPPGAPYPDFIASDTQILVNDTISFTDLTTGSPDSWYWTFVGGEPTHSTEQNPSCITYYYQGDYTVSLSTSNSYGSSYKTKHYYIHIAGSDPTVDYCDTLSNLSGYDSLMVIPVAPWGYIPGHNYFNINEYADLFIDSTYEEINGLIVPVHIAASTISISFVRFKIWDGDTIPGNILGQKDIPISSMSPNFYRYVEFDEPVPVTGRFFAGYQINYNTGDDFAASVGKNQDSPDSCTLFLKYNNQWVRLSDVSLFGNYSTSMGIMPVACSPNSIQETSPINSGIIVYPNPANKLVNILTGTNDMQKYIIRVFDLTGQLIQVEIKQKSDMLALLDFSNTTGGLYMICLTSENLTITKKIFINK